MDECFRKHFPGVHTEVSPEDRIEVFPKATQVINDALVSGQVDIVHASPAVQGVGRSRCDTVLIRKGDAITLNQLGSPSYGMPGEAPGYFTPSSTNRTGVQSTALAVFYSFSNFHPTMALTCLWHISNHSKALIKLPVGDPNVSTCIVWNGHAIPYIIKTIMWKKLSLYPIFVALATFSQYLGRQHLLLITQNLPLIHWKCLRSFT